MARNEAWVSVGRDHDTPAFAVASIRHWWQEMGCDAYPDATALFITADAGGSNGYRSRAWKHELQQLADETILTIHVSHFPPGTSKWNKIFEVRAVHSRELHTALSKAYVAGGRTAPAYTDPVIVALLTPVKAVHFTELQAAVVALDGEWEGEREHGDTVSLMAPRRAVGADPEENRGFEESPCRGERARRRHAGVRGPGRCAHVVS